MTAAPNATRRRMLIGCAVLAGAIVLLLATEWASISGSKPKPATDTPASREAPASPAPNASPGVTGGPTPVRAFNASRIPPPAAEGARSPLADALNHPQRAARDDVATVAELFANYLEIFRKLPVGTNAEITAALAGDNARGLAPLPPDNQAISGGGELVDRWGTPYFFHHVSREIMEIRAAGPDRRHFTSDDVVWPESETVAMPAAMTVSGR